MLSLNDIFITDLREWNIDKNKLKIPKGSTKFICRRRNKANDEKTNTNQQNTKDELKATRTSPNIGVISCVSERKADPIPHVETVILLTFNHCCL